MDENPYAVLKLSPTLDLAAVKRAYFREIQQYPPHQDPKGFKRIRDAYEQLLRPGALGTAFMRAPIDVATLRARFEKRFGARLIAAQSAARESRAAGAIVVELVDRLSRLTLAEAAQLSANRG